MNVGVFDSVAEAHPVRPRRGLELDKVHTGDFKMKDNAL
jgi:hypothetical protein